MDQRRLESQMKSSRKGLGRNRRTRRRVAIKTLINLATQEGFDSVAIITGKAKNHAVSASQEIAKGNRGFYDGYRRIGHEERGEEFRTLNFPLQTLKMAREIHGPRFQ